MRTTSLAAILLLTIHHAARAQRVVSLLSQPVSQSQVGAMSDSVTSADQGVMAVAGMGGAFLGLFIGGKVGCGLDRSRGDDGCLAGAVEGLLIGESAGLGLGVHLGNRSRGNALVTVLASTGVLVTGLVALEHGCRSDSCTSVIALGIPVFQIVAAIAAERAFTEPH